MRVLLFIAIFFGALSLAVGLTGRAQAATMCQPPKASKINIKPETLDVRYNYSKSLEELQKFESGSINPYGFHQKSQVRGLMRGGIKVHDPDIKFGLRNVKDPRSKGEYVCAWYDSITLKITIDPEIMIAKEVAADKCMHNAVRVHELKHIKVDRQIVNNFSRAVGNKINEALKSRNYAGGPVPAGQEQELVNAMGEIIFKIIIHERKKMNLERAERQQAVDTLEEYEHITNQCPNFRE